MVLTNLLIACNFESTVKKIIKKPFEAIFHLNANLAAAYALGLISGYPQGAYAISQIYDKGGCTKDEAERALAFCNNTGPAFIIGGIGSMCGDRNIAISLFLLQIGISLVYGIITRPKKTMEYTEIKDNRTIGFEVIPKAVTASVIPMLNICGFVLIFAVVCDMITHIPMTVEIKGLIYAVLEISNASAFITDNSLSIALLAFSVIWSGMSVHMQTHSVVSGRFSMKRYYIGKIIQSVSVFLIIYLKNPVR